MAIPYKVIPVKQPGKQGEVKYYGRPVLQGSLSLEEIAARMALESTVTEHDVKAILSSLQQHVIDALKSGQSVRLGDLGSFHLTFTGKGTEKKEDYSVKSQLKAVRVQFTKSARMRRELSLTSGGLKFRNVATNAEQ